MGDNDEMLAGELAAAKRTLGLARYRLDQDAVVWGNAESRGRRPGPVGYDRDLMRRYGSALKRVRRLELLIEAA